MCLSSTGGPEEEFSGTAAQGDAADVGSQGSDHGYEMRAVRDREPVTCGLLGNNGIFPGVKCPPVAAADVFLRANIASGLRVDGSGWVLMGEMIGGECGLIHGDISRM